VIIDTDEIIAGPLLPKLKTLPHLGREEIEDKSLFSLPWEGVKASDIVSLLARRGVKIEEARERKVSLEEVYTAILKKMESL
jgi:hypothetical protein